MSASEAIKGAMAKRSLRQIDLLDICGTRARVSEIVNGRRAVPKSMAEALSKRLGLPLDALIRNRIVDSDGVEVVPGCTLRFSYGIPPVGVVAPVVERDGELFALTDGHNPAECPVRDLEGHVGSFFVCKEKW